MMDPASFPDKKGSSENDSNPRPPSGDRCIFIVGPSQQLTPFAEHSFPSKIPASFRSSMSQVAPSAVPHGRHAAGTLLKNLVPRMPFGPSLVRIEGTLNLGSGLVCQKSIPGKLASRYHLRTYSEVYYIPLNKLIFSWIEALRITSSTSKDAAVRTGLMVILTTVK